MQDDEIDALIARLHESRDRWRGPNRQAVLDQAGGTGAVLASHDDETVSEVAENHALGIRVSEFPVRRAAAAAARALGMEVIAGAPNLVRGGSHSGNVAVADLLGAGLVDALASDYVPASLIECAFRDGTDPILLPRAVALVTEGPARIARFADRGRLAPGLRADLVRVHTPHAEPRLPIIRRVWREGAVIA
jgi:alpha-D-ribose 1-methylphosphonate 5-triphosphate diphosphatase